jgi:hypothetical protein
MFDQAKPKPLWIKRRLRSMAALALATLLACGAAHPLVQAKSQGPTVTASFADGNPVGSREQIKLRMSRPPDQKLAVLIGHTDMTALFRPSDLDLIYSGALPLPAGENPVVVYLVSADNQWNEIGRFVLRISDSAPAPPVNASSSNGNHKASFTPTLTIGVKSQVAETHFPDSNRPERARFADFFLQGSLRSEMKGGPIGLQSQFDVVGSSFQREALRFAQEGNNAPRIDMPSYLMQVQTGKARFQMGHIAFGTNRHLINNFSSRGVSINMPIAGRADVSIAAMNGTSIVGWDNFIGLNNRKHQIVAGTLGFDFLRERPGGLRLEGGILHGSLQPISNFNQGNITDAEQSKGLSFRFLASDPAQRIRLDAGFARSAFNNPSDPLLSQSFGVVDVLETSRNARYADLGVDILRNAALGKTRRANLAVNYRHETIDPLFRSVAAFNQADRFQNQVEVVANIADVTATFSHLRFNDNLDDIPSILKTRTRRSGLILGAPLVSFFGDPSKPSPWYPRLSYAVDRTHQFGDGTPINSGFSSASQVPDQASTNQVATADWQFQRVRFGYRFNHSFQDNRQSGREQADLRNLINGFTVGLNPSSAIDLNLDISLESAKNFETGRIDNTDRIGANVNWRMSQRAVLAATVSTIFAGDATEISRSRNAELDLQWSYRLGVERSRFRKMQSQFFVRYANRYARSLDNLFGLNSLTKVQTLNMGLSFTFF